MTLKATDFRPSCGFQVNVAFADRFPILEVHYCKKLKRLKQCPLWQLLKIDRKRKGVLQGSQVVQQEK